MQKSFVLDINACTGCQACELACSIENELDPHMSWRHILTFNEQHVPDITSFHLSLACNHCVDPPCMKHCPALAYSKDPVTGAVTIDPSSCIGCKYCAWACPYDAPQFNRVTGLMEKCTFCSHRLRDGLEPACVTSCPTGALKFGDFDGDANSSTLGFPQADAQPAIRFVALEEGRRLPRAAESVDAAAGTYRSRLPASPASKINLRSEWTLVSFTLLAAILVATFVSMASASRTAALVYIGTGAFAMTLSTLHLGQKMRAYRALLNWRHSWLSREVILFSSFLGLSSIYVISGATDRNAWRFIVFVGLAALFAIDRVYGVTATRRLGMHSARALLGGLFFAGLFLGNPPLYFVAGAAKLLLYLHRKLGFFKSSRPIRPAASLARIGFGFAAPLWVWFLDPASFSHFGLGAGLAPLPAAGLLSILIGETVDRCEFYLELEVPTPRGQMTRDFQVAAGL